MHWHFWKGNYFFPDLFLLACCIKHIEHKRSETLRPSQKILLPFLKMCFVFSFEKNARVWPSHPELSQENLLKSKSSQAGRNVFPPYSCHKSPVDGLCSLQLQSHRVSPAGDSAGLGWPEKDAAWVSVAPERSIPVQECVFIHLLGAGKLGWICVCWRFLHKFCQLAGLNFKHLLLQVNCCNTSLNQ